MRETSIRFQPNPLTNQKRQINKKTMTVTCEKHQTDFNLIHSPTRNLKLTTQVTTVTRKKNQSDYGLTHPPTKNDKLTKQQRQLHARNINQISTYSTRLPETSN